MKTTAMSVWVFINLVCFGMCGYIYLIWSQYWMDIEKHRLFNTSPENSRGKFIESNIRVPYLHVPRKHSYVALDKSPTLKNVFIRKRSAVFRNRVKVFEDSTRNYSSKENLKPSNHFVRKEFGSPRFPNIHKPVLEFDSQKYICRNISASECQVLSSVYKNLLIKEFHRVLMDESGVFKSGVDAQNPYNVKYKGKGRLEISGTEVLCALQRVPLDTVTRKDEPFSNLGFKIPVEQLHQTIYNTCAVVTSAGALLNSNLGALIDTHEMVLRFNNAPTDKYTNDVGSKTTFRILNSQVVAKPEFDFLNDDLYKNVSILIWDPANFSSTLEDWYNQPDFPLFPVYKKFLDDKPRTDARLLKPYVLWELWKVLQDFSPYRLRRNPPSSGLIGIWFALYRCRRVRVFEYVPSVRVTRRCHYYRPTNDSACTLGIWHPLAQEKRLAERMRDNTDIEVFQRGFIEIPGFVNVNCD